MNGADDHVDRSWEMDNPLETTIVQLSRSFSRQRFNVPWSFHFYGFHQSMQVRYCYSVGKLATPSIFFCFTNKFYFFQSKYFFGNSDKCHTLINFQVLLVTQTVRWSPQTCSPSEQKKQQTKARPFISVEAAQLTHRTQKCRVGDMACVQRTKIPWPG